MDPSTIGISEYTIWYTDYSNKPIEIMSQELELVSTQINKLITTINLSNHRPYGRAENETGSPFKKVSKNKWLSWVEKSCWGREFPFASVLHILANTYWSFDDKIDPRSLYIFSILIPYQQYKQIWN